MYQNHPESLVKHRLLSTSNASDSVGLKRDQGHAFLTHPGDDYTSGPHFEDHSPRQIGSIKSEVYI
jgi:hypothetical protein